MITLELSWYALSVLEENMHTIGSLFSRAIFGNNNLYLGKFITYKQYMQIEGTHDSF